MEKITHIGEAIRYVRHTLRLKIELVALEAGCAPSNLSRIENGRQKPSVTLLEALAQAMQTSVSELYRLVENNGPTPPTSAQDKALPVRDWLFTRQRLDALSPERRHLVLQLLSQQFDEQRQLHQANLETNSHVGHAGTALPLAAARHVA